MIFKQRCQAKISKSALLNNYNAIKKFSKSEVMAVVKANAYGHDALLCAKLLEETGASYLAVTSIDEAIYLRENGVVMPVLVLGPTPVEFAKNLVFHNLTQTVVDLDYAKKLSEELANCEVSLKVHIKVDSGMGRLGLVFQKSRDLPVTVNQVIEIYSLESLVPEGIFTHLSSADGEDESDVEFTKEQFKLFESLAKSLSESGIDFKYCHISNSAGVANYPSKVFNMVRPGLSLYGYTSAARNIGLQPVLTLSGEVSSLKNLPKGTPISYNRTYILPSDCTVATISAGYADGVNRALSNLGSVMIGGKKCPILGRVCMDYIMVDVTDCAVNIGDQAFIICDEIDACEHAKMANTIEYEILCNISARVPRLLVE